MNIAESILIQAALPFMKPSSWRLMLLGVRLFPAITDRLLGSEQGQARIHREG